MVVDQNGGVDYEKKAFSKRHRPDRDRRG